MAANGGYDVLSVRFSPRAGTVVVHLIGELAVVTAPAFGQALSLDCSSSGMAVGNAASFRSADGHGG